MAFDQEVRDYLEEVDRRPRAPGLSRQRHVDANALRAHFLGRLRALESRVAPPVLEALYRDWSPKLDRFARYIEELSQQEAPIDKEQALAFARDALDLALQQRDSSMSLVDQLELARVVDGFARPNWVAIYALENRLVHRDMAHHIEVTELGRAFLRLRGRDAVRWLLIIEVAQSHGDSDPWRASRELLESALSKEGIDSWRDQDWNPCFRFEVTTLQRLARLRVLMGYANSEDDEPYNYRVTETMREVVQRVLEGGPWHAAVAALLDDQRADAIPMLRSRSTEAAVEQTRMIAHEVRNALIPVRHHVDALLRAADAASRVRLEKSRHGVARVLAFIDEMVATSELLNEPLTSLDVADVIRGARDWLDGGDRIELALPAEAVKIRGRRSRLQRAVSNVMLNALQATSTKQRVRTHVHCSAGRVEIVVDDEGPGVPEESRLVVFQDGFTTRGGAEGSGFGLAYVRRVVEDLQGRVWCAASDLGGARFVIELPEGEVDR